MWRQARTLFDPPAELILIHLRKLGEIVKREIGLKILPDVLQYSPQHCKRNRDVFVREPPDIAESLHEVRGDRRSQALSVESAGRTSGADVVLQSEHGLRDEAVLRLKIRP